MKQRGTPRADAQRLAIHYNIANRCDRNRRTPRADAQRLAIHYNIAHYRDRNRGCKAYRSDKLLVTW